MKTIFSQSLTRKTDTSEEKITVTVEELPNSKGLHLSYKGMKTDWKGTPSVSPIVGQVEGSPFATAETAIALANQLIEKMKGMGYRLDDGDEELPSHAGDFQTHVRTMPPR